MTDFDAANGRELDALVAERLMGWKLDPNQKAEDGSPLLLNVLPSFSGTAPAARGVMFTLEQRHPGIIMRHELASPHRFVVRGPSGREYVGQDESEATAMCRAMLKAIDGEGPGNPVHRFKPAKGSQSAVNGAEALAARAQAHQSIGLSAIAMVLQQGEHKEGAARAILQYATSVSYVVPHVAEQARRGEPDIAQLCVATLRFLARAGRAAQAALPAAVHHPDAEVAKAAREALDDP